MIATFKSEEHSWLSNMAYVDITVSGRTYPSVEHAYMSAKSRDPWWKDYCADRSHTAAMVKSRAKLQDLRENWEEIKLIVMRTCLRQKFATEPFRTKLLETGDQNIQEGNTWGDEFWGVNLNKSPNRGENHLGRLIMEIRDELKNKKNDR